MFYILLFDVSMDVNNVVTNKNKTIFLNTIIGHNLITLSNTILNEIQNIIHIKLQFASTDSRVELLWSTILTGGLSNI